MVNNYKFSGIIFRENQTHRHIILMLMILTRKQKTLESF